MTVEFSVNPKIRKSLSEYFGVEITTQDALATLTIADFKMWINTLTHDDLTHDDRFCLVRIKGD